MQHRERNSSFAEFALAIFLVLGPGTENVFAQETLPPKPGSIVPGGVYDKPFMTRLGGRTAIGGYMDLTGRFTRSNGISEGWSFEARRFNLFTYSTLADGIVVASEIEFEHGGEEIKLEYGFLDLELHDAAVLRAGVVLVPLGRVNLAHDSPLLELVERPLVSTDVIPSTFSETGAGLWGTIYPVESIRFSYEVYAVNGLSQGILEAGGETFIPAGRNATFEEDNNGEPSFTGRFAVSPLEGSDLGLSFYTGAYNRFEADGLPVDARRTVTILAFDAQTEFAGGVIAVEAADARVGIPASLEGIMASRQRGYSIQADVPFGESWFVRWPRSILTASIRWEGLDRDAMRAGDDTDRLTVGLNLRPVRDAVVKFNYEHSWLRDREGNPSRSARVMAGVAAYF